MPIEDVDYLKQNSIIQSYIFLIDSRDRDHEAYPTPSEYVASFTAPFTNVIGMQLIDASIPRTMYNIDSYNNTLSFYIRSYGNTSPLYGTSNYKTVTIDPGNYTIQTLIPALTSALTMNINDDPNYPTASIIAKTVSNPPDLKNKIEFRCSYPFAFDMKNSTIAETLGFDLFPVSSEKYLYKKINMPTDQSNQQIFGSVNFATSNSIYGNNTEESSYCNILYQPLVPENSALVDVSSNHYVAQLFTVPARAYISSIAAAFNNTVINPVPYSVVMGTSNTPLYSLDISFNASNTYSPGYSNYSSSNIQQSGNLVTSNITTFILNRATSNNTYTTTSNINTFSGFTPNIYVNRNSNITSSVVQSIRVSSITVIDGISYITSNIDNIITSNITTNYLSNVIATTSPLLSSSFDITNTQGGLTTSVIQSPTLMNTDRYYWLMIGSNSIIPGSNTDVYYCSNVSNLSRTVLLRSTTSGLTWTPTINGISTSNQLVTNIDSDLLYSDTILSEPYNLFVGPRGVLRKLPVSSTKYVAQRFVVNTRTFFQTVRAAFAYDSGYPVPFSVHIGTELQPYMSSDYTLFSSNMNIDFVNGTLSETTITTPVLLVENVYYWLVFGNSSMTSTTDIYYNDINPYIGVHTLYSTTDSGTSWTTPDVADINYNLSVQISVADEYNRIEAPGIFNLIGEPYIVVRCPEIEQNSFRSLSFMKHSLGLAKINLGIVGYADTRFDYSSVPARDFHPIGKFSRMTLRFETSKGYKYDFKGVNHTLTFAIRYYEPVQKSVFEHSIINPNYDGNFLRYMYHRGDDNAEEDSDDDEEDYSRDNIANYRVVEARNSPERLEYEDREMGWYYKE
jgi:hypothetical protein